MDLNEASEGLRRALADWRAADPGAALIEAAGRVAESAAALDEVERVITAGVSSPATAGDVS